MMENPYFADASAPLNEQINQDKAEQNGSYPQGGNDEKDQPEIEEAGLKNGDITLY